MLISEVDSNVDSGVKCLLGPGRQLGPELKQEYTLGHVAKFSLRLGL